MNSHAFYKTPFFEQRPILWRIYAGALWVVAFIWRRLMFRTRFIAVTGTVGKTTAKECLAAILVRTAPTVKSLGTANWLSGVPLTILRVRPWHRYAVIEVGAGRRGMMRRMARLVRPDLVLILSVRREHTAEFPTLQHMAHEKAALASGLSPRGILVLNADDALVRAMAGKTRARVCTFGQAPGSDYCYSIVSSPWPFRLRVAMRVRGEEWLLQTNLVGEHWGPSVAGAVTVALLSGASMAEIASGLLDHQPYPGRLFPAALPNGAIFLRDEYGSAPDSFLAAVAVLKQAKARRRIAVIGDISETGLDLQERFRYLGRTAADAAEVLVFVGAPEATLAQEAAVACGVPPESVYAIPELSQASTLLRELLQPGDLVLLKGRLTHHLSRIYYAQLGDVGCWLSSCDRRFLCDECPDLRFVPRVAQASATSISCEDARAVGRSGSAA